MELSIQNIFALMLYTECCAGIIVNLIIVAAKIIQWKTLKSLRTCDKILSCLVISRSLSIFNVFLIHFLYQFYPWLYLNLVFTTTLLTNGMFFHCTNLWFATVLCVFYCVKITSYNWKFFIFLKTKISTLVLWFLLAALIISVSSSLSFTWYFYDINPQHLSNSSEETIIAYKAGIVQNIYHQFLIVLVGSCIPFGIFLVANCLLLHSLWLHTRRMRSSGSGFRSPNLESHFSAVKSMSFFLVLQIIYFVFINVSYSGTVHDYKVLRLVNSIVTSGLPFLHSLYIICSCKEIKKALISMCRCPTRCAQGSNFQ